MTDVSVEPPVPKLVDHTVVYGKVDGEDRGQAPMDPPRRRNDPLFWLRDDSRSDPEVISHLRKEEAYFKAKTGDLAELTETIYREHLSHIQETDITAPYRDGPFLYYTRTVAGLSYKIHCRVPVGKTPGEISDEQIILDENALAAGKAHCEVRSLRPSPDHSRIAYSADFTGDEMFTIYLLDAVVPAADVAASNGGVQFSLIDETISDTNGDIVWGTDQTSLFYTTKDAAKRDDTIWCRVVGAPTPRAPDAKLYHEADTVFSAFCDKSFDGSLLFVGSASSETTEFHYRSLEHRGNEPFTLVRPRENGVRYSVERHYDAFVILTNEGKCPNNKLVIAPMSEPHVWTNVVVAHDPAVYLETMCVFSSFLVVHGRFGGLTRVWTLSALEKTFSASQALREVAADEAVFTMAPVYRHCRDFHADYFPMVYSSMTTPSTWFNVCPFSHSKTLVKRRVVGGGFRSEDYVCERRFATAPDGTQIPMSVVFRKGLDLSEPRPCMLYGYGSYGLCVEPEFGISYLPFLDRGMVYVIGHVRGGGEMGRSWYEIGAKYLTKRNTFQDFVSCAEALVASRTTAPSMLACEGRSAGGLLIGAVLNMRPDLFACAVAGVPFVDVMTTMCDPSIPLTTGEWCEWGNPNEYKYFEYMKSYSPIDNVCAQDYPHLFVHAGLHDPRVAFWEPAKWVAKLRMTKTDKNDVLLKLEMDSGHFSASDRYKYLKEMALQQAFVIKHVLRRLK